ncbi:uncharacterized protein N7500_008064 [Penicillium coprophilum]|uniref:uncharacterized protein n=1 Tax=Penicillium coprophilum TaxID=36646 RepID=UPI00239C1DCD|nr:uncharacterized protein N7500_008064 [Penicillium coprophilum]KAJ5158413.1 hypothetical protein N7500_008064 [Penicillium coprophilum]
MDQWQKCLNYNFGQCEGAKGRGEKMGLKAGIDRETEASYRWLRRGSEAKPGQAPPAKRPEKGRIQRYTAPLKRFYSRLCGIRSTAGHGDRLT